MNRSTLVLLSFLLVLAACDSSDAPAYQDERLAMVQFAPQSRSQYLAYEHSVDINVNREELQTGFDSVLESCAADESFECTILDSRIEIGDRASASIRLRVLPGGVGELIAIASETGEVSARATRVEDLEKSILDTNARIAMLTGTRDRLIAIESEATGDVDSLIKIATELGRVQSELEQLQGRSAHQSQRVNKQILTISYHTKRSTSFWAPIGESLSGFGSNLSEGIRDAITVVAYLLPWLVVLFVFLVAIRALWRRRRR